MRISSIPGLIHGGKLNIISLFFGVHLLYCCWCDLFSKDIRNSFIGLFTFFLWLRSQFSSCTRFLVTLLDPRFIWFLNEKFFLFFTMSLTSLLKNNLSFTNLRKKFNWSFSLNCILSIWRLLALHLTNSMKLDHMIACNIWTFTWKKVAS